MILQRYNSFDVNANRIVACEQNTSLQVQKAQVNLGAKKVEKRISDQLEASQWTWRFSILMHLTRLNHLIRLETLQ